LAHYTYDELLGKLTDRWFVEVSAGLSANLAAFYGPADPWPAATIDHQKRAIKVRSRLALLTAICSYS